MSGICGILSYEIRSMMEDRYPFVEDAYAEEDLRLASWKCRPERASVDKNEWRFRQYGLTLADYEQLLQKQSGVCAICGGTNKNGKLLAVDHCHETGRVRGLLCSTCNSGIGMLRDDPDLCRLAAKYLEQTQ